MISLESRFSTKSSGLETQTSENLQKSLEAFRASVDERLRTLPDSTVQGARAVLPATRALPVALQSGDYEMPANFVAASFGRLVNVEVRKANVLEVGTVRDVTVRFDPSYETGRVQEYNLSQIDEGQVDFTVSRYTPTNDELTEPDDLDIYDWPVHEQKVSLITDLINIPWRYSLYTI